MNYVDIDAFLEAVRGLVAGLGTFKDVVVSHATDTGQLLEEMEAASVPAAIVGLGDVEYDEEGVRRTLRPVIVVLDTFRRGGSRRAASVWSLAKGVEGLFQARLESGETGYREVLGIPFWLSEARPLALSGRLAAVAVSLEGVEYI